ncbi:MAG TPA: helix-turn-helix transcriptional regulator [Thermoanaerobaculia bacterium]|nr:helix-turn-helix transcriptional regulator [Thermoanaerobaculia bacterium]
MENTIFNELGHALRWLRDRQGKKQYQVAEAAGITKGMLSAYETGRQKPSLDTLEKILMTLEVNLNDLHAAIQLVNGRPIDPRPRTVSWAGGGGEPAGFGLESGQSVDPRADLYRILAPPDRLPAEEELALTEMLSGIYRLIRYLHRSLRQDFPRASPTPLPFPPVRGDDE